MPPVLSVFSNSYILSNIQPRLFFDTLIHPSNIRSCIITKVKLNVNETDQINVFSARTDWIKKLPGIRSLRGPSPLVPSPSPATPSPLLPSPSACTAGGPKNFLKQGPTGKSPGFPAGQSAPGFQYRHIVSFVCTVS